MDDPVLRQSVYDDPAPYWAVSAIRTIKSAHTPTFIYVGERDIEVPPTQSVEYWHALQAMNVPISLVIYPDEGHAIRAPEHMLDIASGRWPGSTAILGGRESPSRTSAVTLPIEAVLPELLEALRKSTRALLVAPPGAGKTTRVAPALLGEDWCTGEVLLLVPRRLAARAAAEFMARELGEKPGETIGYATRLDSKVGKTTRVDRHDPRRVPGAHPGRSRARRRIGGAVRRSARTQPRQ